MTKAVSGAAESKVSLVDLETLRRHQHSAVEKKRRQRFQEALFKLKQVSGCFAKEKIEILLSAISTIERLRSEKEQLTHHVHQMHIQQAHKQREIMEPLPSFSLSPPVEQMKMYAAKHLADDPPLARSVATAAAFSSSILISSRTRSTSTTCSPLQTALGASNAKAESLLIPSFSSLHAIPSKPSPPPPTKRRSSRTQDSMSLLSSASTLSSITRPRNHTPTTAAAVSLAANPMSLSNLLT